MKWLLLLTLIAVVDASCKKEATSTIPLQEQVDTATAEAKSRGQFMNGPFGSVSGSVIIYESNAGVQLALQDMVISNGPDLHVYLSMEEQPLHFIDLGRLKSIAGDQVYPLASGADLSRYNYVLIHCQQYNHLFGSARLGP